MAVGAFGFGVCAPECGVGGLGLVSAVGHKFGVGGLGLVTSVFLLFGVGGLGLVGWGWARVVCAFQLGVGESCLVGRGVDLRVSALRCGVGPMCNHLGGMWAHLGLGVCGPILGLCWRIWFGVGGLGLVGRRLGRKVWGWWVGAGQEWRARFSLELVGRVWSGEVWT